MPKTLTDFFNDVNGIFDNSAPYADVMLGQFDAGTTADKVRIAVMVKEHGRVVSALLTEARTVPGLVERARTEYRATGFDAAATAQAIIAAADALVSWVDANIGSNLTAAKGQEFRALLIAFRDAATVNPA